VVDRNHDIHYRMKDVITDKGSDVLQRAEQDTAGSRSTPLIWGLTPRALHDAYWQCRGVQVIRAAEKQPIDGDAELFLLVDSDELVVFNLAEIRDRLLWRNALVTRLRVVAEEGDPYREEVVLDDDGYIKNIARRYNRQFHGSRRVVLTQSRRMARRWMSEPNARSAWSRLRRTMRWTELDHLRVAGRGFVESDAGETTLLLEELTRCWSNPDTVIEDIQQVADGVWAPSGAHWNGQSVLIGPLWLGYGVEAGDPDPCLVGPAWRGDQTEPPVPHRIRPIAEIEPDENSATNPQPDEPSVLYPAAKRLFDIVFSASAIIVTLPLWFVVALCIVLEDGRPIFYYQMRESRHGKLFRCWKFRSMKHNAEKLMREHARENICDGPQVFIRDDPRITRVGRVIRRFQIDEFPQFWNVLLGQMSIVGPRPSPVEENQMCPAWRDLRLSVRPGITGLWQLHRTRQPGMDFQEWIKYDIDYVRRASFWLDLRICFQTVWKLLGRRRSSL